MNFESTFLERVLLFHRQVSSKFFLQLHLPSGKNLFAGALVAASESLGMTASVAKKPRSTSIQYASLVFSQLPWTAQGFRTPAQVSHEISGLAVLKFEVLKKEAELVNKASFLPKHQHTLTSLMLPEEYTHNKFVITVSLILRLAPGWEKAIKRKNVRSDPLEMVRRRSPEDRPLKTAFMGEAHSPKALWASHPAKLCCQMPAHKGAHKKSARNRCILFVSKNVPCKQK